METLCGLFGKSKQAYYKHKRKSFSEEEIEQTILSIVHDYRAEMPVLSRKGTITLRSSLGLLSVVGRWNRARYKRSKRDGNLNKQHFLVIRSSLVVPWFFFGSSLVFDTEHIYKVQGKGILIFVLFRGRRKRLQFRV